MLTGKNLVMLEGKPGREYGREYLTHGPTDETETYPKTSKGKTVQIEVDGKLQDWAGIRPKGDSKVPVTELVQEALNRLSVRYPMKNADKATDEEKANYPWRLFLSAADYGADLWMRGEIQADIAPTKPISKEDGIKKAVKLLGQMHP